MSEKTYYIYKHTNKLNGKVYIGQTSQKPEYRWNHGAGYSNGNAHFSSAIQKYGWDNFTHEILYEGLTLEEANRIEIELITQYQATDRRYGYNKQPGGGNKTVSDDTKQLQSISAIKRPIITTETKEKLSAINKGRSKSEETKIKMSAAAKLREANKKSKTRKVRCINTQEIFPSLRAAANWCGLAGTSGIALVCQGRKQKTAGVHPSTKEKLRWEYIDMEEK